MSAKPKRAKAKISWVWDHFREVGNENDPKARCTLCQSCFPYKGGSTSNLARHLTGVHGKKGKEVAQHNILPYMKISLTRQSLIDTAVVDLVACSSLSFRITEEPSFAKMMETIAPGYVLPSRQTLRNAMVKKGEEHDKGTNYFFFSYLLYLP
jgi:hypothetical protein